MAIPDSPKTRGLTKREDGDLECYDWSHLDGFSALCPNTNFPITNDRGLNEMGTLYFALASTSLPDDTVYHAQENIICTVNGKTEEITATISASLSRDVVSAGASVSFNLGGVNWASTSLCMLTEGTGDDDKNVTDPITLAQARTLLYTMITAPNNDCKTCGRIPIRYPDVKDGGAPIGGILKIEVTSHNNCLGKCVGPASFSTATASPSPSPSVSDSPSPTSTQSIAMRIQPFSESTGLSFVAVAIIGCLFGMAVVQMGT